MKTCLQFLGRCILMSLFFFLPSAFAATSPDIKPKESVNHSSAGVSAQVSEQRNAAAVRPNEATRPNELPSGDLRLRVSGGGEIWERGRRTAVPEGGSTLAYVSLAGLACAGTWLFRRRKTATGQA